MPGLNAGLNQRQLHRVLTEYLRHRVLIFPHQSDVVQTNDLGALGAAAGALAD
jgi:hypothetical protein